MTGGSEVRDTPAVVFDHRHIRERYSRVARLAFTRLAESRAEPLEIGPSFGPARYAPDDLGWLPPAAVVASLGCGSPSPLAGLVPGDRVLDLGSGGGADVLLAARQVGRSGVVFGVDLTVEMALLGRRAALEADMSNVHFLGGAIEDLPFGDGVFDVVISNCSIHFALRKAEVIKECGRVLASGGSICLVDLVASDWLSLDEQRRQQSATGRTAGALTVDAYRSIVAEAGFVDVSLTLTHNVSEDMHAAVIRGRKPSAAEPSAAPNDDAS